MDEELRKALDDGEIINIEREVKDLHSKTKTQTDSIRGLFQTWSRYERINLPIGLQYHKSYHPLIYLVMEDIFQCYHTQKKIRENSYFRLETLLNSLVNTAKPIFIRNLDRILHDELPKNYFKDIFNNWKTWEDWTSLSPLLSSSVIDLGDYGEEHLDEQDSSNSSSQDTKKDDSRSFSGLLFEFNLLIFLIYYYHSYKPSNNSPFLEKAQISRYIQGSSVEQKLLRKQLTSERVQEFNQGKLLQYKIVLYYLVQRVTLVYSSLSSNPQLMSKLTFSIKKILFDKVQSAIIDEDWESTQDLLTQIRPLPSVIEALLKKSDKKTPRRLLRVSVPSSETTVFLFFRFSARRKMEFKADLSIGRPLFLNT